MGDLLVSLEEILRRADDYEPPKPKVLVVDDEETVRVLVTELFDADKYEVLEADSGDGAIELIAREEPRVVVIDKNLPGLSGIEVIRSGKKMFAEVEFILMTGFSSMESAIEAVEVGAFGYIPKPFADIKEVRARVDAAIAKQRVVLQNRYLVETLRIAYDTVFQAQVEADIDEVLVDNVRAELKAKLNEWARPFGDMQTACEALAAFAAGEVAVGNDRAFSHVARAKNLMDQMRVAVEQSEGILAALDA